MRESLGASFDKNMQQSGIYERPIDRIGALGFANELGSYLIRAKYGLQKNGLKCAKIMLMHEASKKINCSLAMLERLAELALSEWMEPLCRRCNGTKYAMIGDVKSVCPACEGVGVHRYSNRSRARALGVPSVDKGWLRKINIVSAILSRIESDAVRVVATQLEK